MCEYHWIFVVMVFPHLALLMFNSLKMLNIHRVFRIVHVFMLKISGKEPRHFPFNKTITKSQMVTVRYPNLPLFLSQQIYLSMLFAASSINYIKLRLPSQIIKCKILAAWVQHELSSMTIQMWCILFSNNLIRSLFCISLSSKERKEKTPTVFLRLLWLCKWNLYIV